MKFKNKIFNYFVIPPLTSGGVPRVFLSPVTMNAKVAKPLMAKQLKKQDGTVLPSGNLLHVCFDYDSGMIYIPNASDFSANQMEPLLKAAEVRITKDFGSFSSRLPIAGSPFSSLRVRSIESFSYAKEIIQKHYKGKIFKTLPVIEVNLGKMPTVLKSLPEEFRKNEEFLGSYISPSFANSITFVDELDNYGRKIKEPRVLLTQKTPFILINVAQNEKRKEPTATEKEWVVLNGYRDYLYDADTSEEEKYAPDDITKFADLYAIKRYLYLGWSFEEVSSYLLRNVQNFGGLIKAIDLLMQAVDSLVQEGYKSPASIPYYITFKINPKMFPLKIESVIDKNTGQINSEIQYKNFLIIDYDMSSGYILIETPAFVSPDICRKVLKAESPPFICKYNSMINKIDIKSERNSVSDLQKNRVQLAKIKGIVRSDLDEEKKDEVVFRGGAQASGENVVNPNIFVVRKISDYHYAADFIKKMCEQNNVPFEDFDVVVGPIENKFGRGTMGGFIDEKLFRKNKWDIPFELEKDIYISPPVMMVNSVEIPSYAEQTETLIHEYRHYIFGLNNPNYEITYDRPKKRTDYEHWWKYLSDANERAAHKEEIKFELGLGKSYDEIIRNKVGGQITAENYPIALKFAELVKEALKELEEEGETDEKPTGTS